NPERIILDDALAPLPALNVGDRLPGAHHGVLDYEFGYYRLLLTATPRRVPAAPARETTRPQKDGELAVATARLDGVHPGSPPSRFARLAGDIVTGLRSPDLIAVTELGDTSGPDDDGTVAADRPRLRRAGGDAPRQRRRRREGRQPPARIPVPHRPGARVRRPPVPRRPAPRRPARGPRPCRDARAGRPPRRDGGTVAEPRPDRARPRRLVGDPQARRRGGHLAGPPPHRHREPVVPADRRRPAAVRPEPAPGAAQPVAPRRAGPRRRRLRAVG